MPASYGYNGYGFNDSEYRNTGDIATSLQKRFRLLWEQHIYWTRLVIMGIAYDLPDLDASTTRLLRNPSDFARVFFRYYGGKIAAEIESLIRDHLTIAAKLVKAAKAGNAKAAENAEQRWYRNAQEIAAFLAHINPAWPYEDMKEMWFDHLALTKDEAVAILHKEYGQSIQLFDRIEKLALKMSDAFAYGIACQFAC